MIRVYGIREQLDPIKKAMSDIISSCMTDALAFPPNKRCHRFFPMEPDNFYYPEGRSRKYTVIEISMMEGRSVMAKKRLIHLLFERIEELLGIPSLDIEITIFDAPASNWGFRGITGDEAILNYPVNV